VMAGAGYACYERVREGQHAPLRRPRSDAS
jgi:hypothetical protein